MSKSLMLDLHDYPEPFLIYRFEIYKPYTSFEGKIGITKFT